MWKNGKNGKNGKDGKDGKLGNGLIPSGLVKMGHDECGMTGMTKVV